MIKFAPFEDEVPIVAPKPIERSPTTVVMMKKPKNTECEYIVGFFILGIIVLMYTDI